MYFQMFQMKNGIVKSKKVLKKSPDKFRIYSIDFSFFEKAWTLRGMENLMMDFVENPGFCKRTLRQNCRF